MTDEITKIFVVYSGDYSERSAVGYFTTRELAQEYIEHERKFDGELDGKIYEEELDLPSNKNKTFIYLTASKDGYVDGVTYFRKGDEYNHYRESEGFEGYYTLAGERRDVLEWVFEPMEEEESQDLLLEYVRKILAADCWGDDEKTKALFGGN